MAAHNAFYRAARSRSAPQAGERMVEPPETLQVRCAGCRQVVDSRRAEPYTASRYAPGYAADALSAWICHICRPPGSQK